ncbi:Tm-1-like ATP-binding domain-containing protein [Salibacterium sp. K-3]
MKKVLLIGTFDTKGNECRFIKDILKEDGVGTVTMNTGVKGASTFPPDISSGDVAERGGAPLEKLIEEDDRGAAVDIMMEGAAAYALSLFESGTISGVISLGGSAGTTIGTHAMQALPIGVPKVMVSTVASGDTRPYVGVKDITMMYSVVDISGINLLSSSILANAAYAVSGMVKGKTPKVPSDKPLIGATMFGLTTPCVTKAKEYLENQGYEVLVFHATGTGGKAMESLAASGYLSGVLDVTTTEWCDELVGGNLSAGPDRLDAVAKAGIPQVVSTGALDMVNFGGMETVPDTFRGRNLYKHNANTTLMRTTAEENRQLGSIIAGKMNAVQVPSALFLPLQGLSGIDMQGQPFYGPEENDALFRSLSEHVTNDQVDVIEMNNHINDETFAVATARKLVALMENKK